MINFLYNHSEGDIVHLEKPKSFNHVAAREAAEYLSTMRQPYIVFPVLNKEDNDEVDRFAKEKFLEVEKKAKKLNSRGSMVFYLFQLEFQYHEMDELRRQLDHLEVPYVLVPLESVEELLRFFKDVPPRLQLIEQARNLGLKRKLPEYFKPELTDFHLKAHKIN